MMEEKRITQMVAQVYGYVGADIPEDWRVIDVMDLLLGTDYFALHAKDKEAAVEFWKLPKKQQKSIVKKVVMG